MIRSLLSRFLAWLDRPKTGPHGVPILTADDLPYHSQPLKNDIRQLIPGEFEAYPYPNPQSVLCHGCKTPNLTNTVLLKPLDPTKPVIITGWCPKCAGISIAAGFILPPNTTVQPNPHDEIEN